MQTIMFASSGNCCIQRRLVSFWPKKRRFTKCRINKQPVSVPLPVKSNQERRSQHQLPPGTSCCAAYQTKNCDKQFDHASFIHACRYCFQNRNQNYKHSESECFSKAREEAKNGAQRS